MAAARHRQFDEIEPLAQGRVWLGSQARDNASRQPRPARHGVPRVKAAEKQIAEKTKALDTARAQILVKSKELTQAQKDEDRARAAVKTTSQKVQDTAAIRELDEKERLKASVARPLKILESTVQSLEQTLAALETERIAAQTQFDELYAIFLNEHANQVEGRKVLQAKQTALETSLHSS